MRHLANPSEADCSMVVEDSAGQGFQFMQETTVLRYSHISNREWDHVIEGGWWDLSMTQRAEGAIEFPVTVVWSGTKLLETGPNT